MKALILGVTGLVGNELLERLLIDEHFSKVTAVSRRPLVSHPKVQNEVLDFASLSKYEVLFNVDIVFCCLGTTIDKAGSKDAFKKVDYDYPLVAAKLLKKVNPRGRFVVITAMGASSTSTLFYNRVKGELEEALEKLNLGRLIIIRPSLILGNRQESRPIESLGQKLARFADPVLKRLLPKYAGIEAWKIAAKMIEVGVLPHPLNICIESDEIKRLGP